jgi:hypothetical protein
MSKSFDFFALDGQQFARRLREDSASAIARLRQQLAVYGYLSAAEIGAHGEDQLTVESVLAAAARICAGDLPPVCPHPYFEALARLADLLCKPNRFDGFQDTRWRYMDAVGILQYFGPVAPFLLPQPKPDGDNGAGFLPAPTIATLIANGLSDLPPTTDVHVQGGREDFLDFLESTTDDGLDVLVVY